jgi:CII-binding regulator of phage lambda lysogenization HflD
MRRGYLQFAVVLTLSAALLVSLGLLHRQRRTLAMLEQQQETDRRSLSQLVAAARQRDFEQAPAAVESPAPPGSYQAPLANRNVTIESLNRELSEAQASIMGLQAQLSNSNEEREKAVANANELLQKEKEDWQTQLESLKQDLESAQADAQASRQRLAALEADNVKLNNNNNAASVRALDLAQVVVQLQDLDSRREALLTSMMRRYRDITSQFRAMSGMLGSNRDSNSGSPFTDSALTRIQSAVTSADDELRQLGELNAQARQLEKKLAKK